MNTKQNNIVNKRNIKPYNSKEYKIMMIQKNTKTQLSKGTKYHDN
jgi:hypothetical protein